MMTEQPVETTTTPDPNAPTTTTTTPAPGGEAEPVTTWYRFQTADGVFEGNNVDDILAAHEDAVITHEYQTDARGQMIAVPYEHHGAPALADTAPAPGETPVVMQGTVPEAQTATSTTTPSP